MFFTKRTIFFPQKEQYFFHKKNNIFSTKRTIFFSQKEQYFFHKKNNIFELLKAYRFFTKQTILLNEPFYDGSARKSSKQMENIR